MAYRSACLEVVNHGRSSLFGSQVVRVKAGNHPMMSIQINGGQMPYKVETVRELENLLKQLKIQPSLQFCQGHCSQDPKHHLKFCALQFVNSFRDNPNAYHVLMFGSVGGMHQKILALVRLYEMSTQWPKLDAKSFKQRTALTRALVAAERDELLELNQEMKSLEHYLNSIIPSFPWYCPKSVKRLDGIIASILTAQGGSDVFF